ncbi:aminodeoxychorismate lyase [Sinimarinibacterium sp. CAU 1509]|uniref:aminodeoxychorismate lyase n=1 Tax=Sinimarinibacterium sp. CAU 1509 TaxID=2562283 RepID=UPI0010AD5CAD|nr:aminodeoxychorismate lyase [Sinimarinibacterium sp. CAU 1509]TJY55769.1 aminodeoxychorismate lyase [Sinimarinibacterium sp. CAU 1509]
MSAIALFNGRPEDDAHARSRGLHYGDGVFRTMLIVDGIVVDWTHHWSKLCADCAVLGLQPPAEADLLSELALLSAGHVWASAKVLVVRRWQSRGYAPTTDASDRLVMVTSESAGGAQAPAAGIDVMLSDIRLGDQPALAGVKHLNRLEQVMASRHWPDTIGEALMLDTRGLLISGTRSNVFCVAGNKLRTPNLERCGVAGVMRQRVIETCASLDWAIECVDLPWSEFLECDEAFICNSLTGIVPLRRCGTREWPSPGLHARQLWSRLSHPRHSLNL